MPLTSFVQTADGFQVPRMVGMCVLMVVLAACGQGSAQSVAPNPTAVPAVQSSSGSSSTSLTGFFPESDDSEPTSVPAEPTAAPETTAPDAPTVAVSPVPAVTSTAGTAGAASDESASDEAGSGEPVLNVEPSAVLLAAEREVTLTGAGWSPEVGVFAAACQLQGEPIELDVDFGELAARVEQIDISNDCDFVNAANAIADADGTFELPLTVDIGPSTVVLASPLEGGFSVFTPIYLDQ